jgi:hypothetical protein
LATIDVSGELATPSLSKQFEVLRHNPECVAERERLAPYVDAAPEKTLAFVAEMDMGAPEGPVVYACPMHPKVVSDKPEHCPKCGMKLLPAELVAQASGHGEHAHHGEGHGHHERHERAYHNGEGHDVAKELHAEHAEHAQSRHGHHAAHGDEHEHAAHGEQHHHSHHGHEHGTAAGGIEWEDDMVDVNRLTTPANMGWNLVDRETVDILLDVTNPGRWMAHCHIAEHHESGMMFSFDVAAADAD